MDLSGSDSNKNQLNQLINCSIVSLDVKNEMLLIGTKGSEIIEVK